MNSKNIQKGFSLFVVLIVMLVIAFLVVAGIQSYNTEMRISSNDLDRKTTMAFAENALKAGENSIVNFTSATTFVPDCTNGLCIPAGGVANKPASLATERFNIPNNYRVGSCTDANCQIAAWERADIWSGGSTRSIAVNNTGASTSPRYIVEYLNVDTAGSYYFRVTARAWGDNPNTIVTLQSYVEATFQ